MAQDKTQFPTPPIDYPSIIIGGVLYFARFTMGSMYRLEAYGLNTAHWDESVQAEVDAGRNVQLTCKLASACLGTPKRDGRWQPFPYGPEELADMVPREDLPKLRATIEETMEKVRRAALDAQEPPVEIKEQTAAA